MAAFSVLDQAPTRADTSPAQSIRDVLGLARHAEALGYRRFWIAEHHAMGGVASTAPEILIGQVAAITKKLRVGSGGMLLPNHRPVHVAEQFLTLAALHPGRIDLGIGRSEGATDDATVRAFQRSSDNSHGAGFDAQLDELLAFGGVRPLGADHPLAGVRAGPAGVPLPPVFLLGSSPNSAATAAARGLGYGFAAYTNPEAAGPALRLYRERFTPARSGDRPHAILGLKVIVGENDEHAEALARPWHLALVRHRAGTPGPLMSVEAALRHRWTGAEREAEAKVDTRADVVGGPDTVRRRLAELLEETQADEVIASSNTFDPADRWASYARLALAVSLRPRASGRPEPWTDWSYWGTPADPSPAHRLEPRLSRNGGTPSPAHADTREARARLSGR
ncbi:MAG TPA: LLM class flavin-dependent oxidoreductase [Solirubrobacteraceae bacterium]